MMKTQISRRIIYAFLILTTTSLSCLGMYLLDFFYQQNLRFQTAHLVSNAKVIETALEGKLGRAEEAAYTRDEIEKISDRTDLRITILDATGEVTADSWKSADSLDNHADRQEIQDAAGKAFGTAIRYSDTLKQNMLYVAVPFASGTASGIVRTASTIAPIEAAYQQTRAVILSSVFLTMLLTLLVGAWLAHRLAKPIEEMTAAAQKIAGGAWDTRIQIRTDDELALLAHTINQLTANLEEKLLLIDAEAKKLALILENMDNAVLLLDCYGNVTTANQKAKEMFALTPDHMGKHSIGVIGNSVLTATANEVLAARQSRSIHLNLQVGHTPKTFEIFFAPIYQQDQIVTGVLSVFHDITALQDVYDRQAAFVANASHELATPLTSIQGFAETLLSGAMRTPALREKFIGIIHTEAKRMSRLVRDLLQLAKLDARDYRKQIEIGEVYMLNVFQATERKLAPQLAKKELRLTMRLPEESVIVQANYDWLVQLMVNLTENAVKYTPPRGEITLSCRREADRIVVAVKDSGIGIAASDLPFIFDRFYRADKSRTRSAGGSGIGLSLARFVIETLGGKITAESRPNEGSTFTFHLPLKPK